MQKVLIATTNEGKYLEISKLLKAYGVESVSLRELDYSPTAKEQ